MLVDQEYLEELHLHDYEILSTPEKWEAEGNVIFRVL